MFDGLLTPETFGLTPRQSGLGMVALLFGGGLLRAGLCAWAERPSRKAHFWAAVGLLTALASIGLLYLLRSLDLAAELAVAALLAGLALRAAGLGLVVYGFGRAGLIGGRAAWLDWVLAAVFALGLLAFSLLLYKAVATALGLGT